MEEKVIISRAEYDLLVAKAYQKVFTVTRSMEKEYLSSDNADQVYLDMKERIETLERVQQQIEKVSDDRRKEIHKLYNRPTYDMFRGMSIIEFIKWRKASKERVDEKR